MRHLLIFCLLITAVFAYGQSDTINLGTVAAPRPAGAQQTNTNVVSTSNPNGTAAWKARVGTSSTVFTDEIVIGTGKDSAWVNSNHTIGINETLYTSDSTTGRVGVGTNAPSTTLDVNGGARIRSLGAGIVISNGTGVLSSTPTVTSIDTLTGLDTISATRGNFTRVVGENALFDTLVVDAMTADSIAARLIIIDSLRLPSLPFTNDSAHLVSTRASGGGIVKCFATCDDIRWTKGTDTLMTVLMDSNDLVGIGTNTPTVKLDVRGGVRIGQSNLVLDTSSNTTTLNDLVWDFSQYTGVLPAEFEVSITTEDNPDSITWYDYTSGTDSTLAIISGTIDLGNGATIEFSNITGHTLNDSWYVNVYDTFSEPPVNVLRYGDSTSVFKITTNGNIGINTNNPDTRLHIVGSIKIEDGNQANGNVLTSFGDGTGYWNAPNWSKWNYDGTSYRPSIDNKNLLSVGTNTGSGAMPINGTGTRMMWVPSRAAFRVGYVSGTQWDTDSVGVLSAAFGSSNVAKGILAFATGQSNTVGGNSSFVANANNNVYGNFSAVFGHQNESHSNTSFIAGLDNIADANSISGVLFGESNLSKNYGASAIGFSLIVNSMGSFAIGMGNDTLPASLFSPQANDILFCIGNGAADGSFRSNALTVLRNANTGINVLNPLGILHVKATSSKHIIFEDLPEYANDAAADADTGLPSEALYKVTGDRGVYQKP